MSHHQDHDSASIKLLNHYEVRITIDNTYETRQHYGTNLRARHVSWAINWRGDREVEDEEAEKQKEGDNDEEEGEGKDK